MPTALEQKRIRDLITQTVAMLCQSSLNFQSMFTVEGLLGITIDDKDVFLINIHEVVSSAKRKKRKFVNKKSVASMSADGDKHTTLSESCVDSMQSQKIQRVKKLTSKQTHYSEPCHAHEPEKTISYDQPSQQIAYSFSHKTDHLGMSLPADIEPLEENLLLSCEAGHDELVSDASRLQDYMNVNKQENISEADTMDSQFDHASQDLVNECCSNWYDKQNTDTQV